MVITNSLLRKRMEEDCIGISHERKYYRSGSSFIKRSLRPSEWQVNTIKGTIVVPRQSIPRLLNEAASLKYIVEHTNIPTPHFHCCFEDDGAAYLITEFIDGVAMSSLSDSQLPIVTAELERHIETLHALTSRRVGGPTDLIVPPYRVIRTSPREEWGTHTRSSASVSISINEEEEEEEGEVYAFCHNDLHRDNIIVDPETLKIKAIIDLEYAGFYPAGFDRAFYKRVGPSVALEGEENDVDEFLALFNAIPRF